MSEELTKVNETIGELNGHLENYRKEQTAIQEEVGDLRASIPVEIQKAQDEIIAEIVPKIMEHQEFVNLQKSNDETRAFIERMTAHNESVGIDTTEQRAAWYDYLANGLEPDARTGDRGLSERSRAYYNSEAVIKETRKLQEDTDWKGGVFVHPELSGEVIKLANFINPLPGICRNINLSGTNAITFPKRTSLPTAYRTGEGEAGAESNSEYGSQTITAHNLQVVTKVTRDLLADVSLMESFITQDAGEALGLKIGTEIITGSAGAGLEGITVNADIESIAGAETVANTITSVDFAELYGALPTQYRGNSTFLLNSASMTSVMKMQSTTGAFIWQETLRDGPAGTIVGRPYQINEAIDSEGSGKYPVFLGDFTRGYFVVNRTPIEVIRDPLSSKPNIEFMFIMRNGGAVVTAEAIKKLSI